MNRHDRRRAAALKAGNTEIFHTAGRGWFLRVGEWVRGPFVSEAAARTDQRIESLAPGQILYCLLRIHQQSDSDVVVPLGDYNTHAEAYEALLADAGVEVLHWSRPNWTAVNSESDIVWCIRPFTKTLEGERVHAEEVYGPTRSEMHRA
jgi:hypothetical protein